MPETYQHALPLKLAIPKLAEKRQPYKRSKNKQHEHSITLLALPSQAERQQVTSYYPLVTLVLQNKCLGYVFVSRLYLLMSLL